MTSRPLQWHRAGVNAASFSPDGKTVVTGSSDGTARLWEAPSGRVLRTLEGHRGQVWSASFSPDGKTVVTGSEDGTAILHIANEEDYDRAYYAFGCRVLRTWTSLPYVADADLAEIKASCPPDHPAPTTK